MIIFHEGMPRSGKSYAVFRDHVIPALKRGREVWIRVDGLNLDQIAQLAGIDPDRCRELVTMIDESDVAAVDKLSIPNDALIVIDELQNYFPATRQPLNPGLTKWIAEHGHHGYDVVAMGQVLKDCHKTWLNRTNRKVQFIKKDMLGKPNEYKWTMYTGSLDARGNVKFTEVSKGDGVYDPAFFGCYASHSSGTDNKATYADDRVNVWKSPAFRKWLPLFVLATVFAVVWLIYVFKGGGLAKAAPAPVTVTKTTVDDAMGENPKVTTTVIGQQPVAQQAKAKEPDKDPLQVDDLIAELSRDNRLRLAAILRTATKTKVIVEWRDTSYRVVQQLDDEALALLGYNVATTNSNSMAILISPGKRMIATAWPIEDQPGKVSGDTQAIIRNEGTGLVQSSRGQSLTQTEPALPEVSFSLAGSDPSMHTPMTRLTKAGPQFEY